MKWDFWTPHDTLQRKGNLIKDFNEWVQFIKKIDNGIQWIENVAHNKIHAFKHDFQWNDNGLQRGKDRYMRLVDFV